ncbi:MAG: RluA family pseudouridine synthase [Candidatus Latescibacterota bacterium]
MPAQAASMRLDLFLGQRCPDLSRSRIQGLIRAGSVLVNQRPARCGYAVRPGDRVALEIPAPTPLQVAAEPLELSVVHEDADLLVIDKPAGMTVHPAPGSWQGTLVNALLHHCPDLSGINGVLRPGIVHRLDKETSGLLVVAKSDAAHRSLASQLETRRLHREYVALVWGVPDAGAGSVDAPIGRHPADRKRMGVVLAGRRAVTHYRVTDRFAFTAGLKLELETGRTHQIRVHLQHIGHPVFGDPVYGGRTRTAGIRPQYRRQAQAMLETIGRQALHARLLRFAHPRTGETIELVAPLPADMERLFAAARG